MLKSKERWLNSRSYFSAGDSTARTLIGNQLTTLLEGLFDGLAALQAV